VSIEPAKVALVTGGARRIGRAIVEDLAEHGWAVAIHANRSREEADRLAAAIHADGGPVVGRRATVVVGDLEDVEGLPAVLAEASAALGPFTLLVNNASTFEPDAVGSLDARLWARQLTVNLAAPVFLAQAFAAQLPDGVEGNIVNILDQRVWKPTPRHFSYQLSKSALFTATVTLAQALAPRVRVNAIGPGPTLPSDRQTEEEFRRQTVALPLGRGAGLEEFGRTIRFLVETPSVTGQMIALDGGQHLMWETAEIRGVSE
jgi:NAD(P)-dependent dehydrogenase (short-subunit alcohol dehydrogenase family)